MQENIQILLGMFGDHSQKQIKVRGILQNNITLLCLNLVENLISGEQKGTLFKTWDKDFMLTEMLKPTLLQHRG